MKVDLKESFKAQSRIHPSFTAGYLRIDKSGDHVLSSTGDTIKILSISDGSEVAAIVEKIDEDVEDTVIDFVTGYHDGLDKVYAAYRSGLLKEWTWNSEGASLRRTWKSLHTGPMSTLAINGDGEGNLLASGSSDTIVKVWDVSKQYCTHHLKGCRGVVSCIQFFENSKEIEFIAASGDLDYSVNIWKLNESQLICHLEGHCSRVIGLQFYEQDDKDFVISASRDMLAIVWSINDGTSLRKIPLFEAVESIVLLPDHAIKGFLCNELPKGQVFLTGGPKGTVKAWDTATGKCLFTQSNSILTNSNQKDYIDQSSELIIQCLLHSNLDKLIVVSFERNILFYDLNNFDLIRQSIGHIDQVSDIKFIGTEEKHIVVATNSPNLTIFHLETLESAIIKGHLGIVLSIQVYPTDKTLFASAAKDNDIRIWEFDATIMSAKCLYIASGHSLSVIALAVPLKTTRWMFSGSEDTTLKVWKIPPKIDNDAKAVHISTLETVKAHEKDINGLAVSPNDKFVASCSQDRTAKLWSFNNNLNLVGVLKGHRRGVWSISFSPVDVIVATASADTTIKIWSLNDFSCLKTLQSHESSVLNFVFVNRGMQIISSSSDGNVKLWTVKTGECSTTLDAHTDKIWALTVNESEELMITGGEDSQIIIWKDDTVEKKEEEAAKEKILIANEQQLMNLIQQQKWTKALKLAIKLDQPFRALNIVKEILFIVDQDKLQVLQASLMGLRQDQLVSLLKYALKWNTNSKNSEAAQYIFRVTLNFLGYEGILNLPESKEIVEGVLSYTKRHLNRVNKLSEQITCINFLYSNIKLN